MVLFAQLCGLVSLPSCLSKPRLIFQYIVTLLINSENSYAQVTVNNPSRVRSYMLTPSRQPMANALGRKAHQSFAKYAVNNQTVRKYIVSGLQKFLKMEVKALCCDSYLLSKTKESLLTFSWCELYKIIQAKAPTILAFLEACVSETSSLDKTTIVGVCAAILAKARRPSASLVQQIISVILYSGHTNKKVMAQLLLYHQI